MSWNFFAWCTPQRTERDIPSHNKTNIQDMSPLDMNQLPVLPVHQYPQFLKQCCQLINAEWKRSDTARLRSLEASCDSLPTSLILLENNRVIGHCKLSAIPSIRDACFLEAVVIDKSLRGKGYGTHLMNKMEDYCRDEMNLGMIYLSTKGQEGFYSKLGYEICSPINIFGSFRAKDDNISVPNTVIQKGPIPPPMPKNNSTNNVQQKTFMNKNIRN